MSVEFDFSDLDTLSAQLDQIPSVAGPYMRSAIEVTSRNIKDAWADKLKDEPRLPHAPRTITYDVDVFRGFGKSILQSEIGAETGRMQAPIVTVIEFGAPGNNTAPRGYGHAALQENENDFEVGLAKATAAAEQQVFNNSSVFRIASAYVKGPNG